MTAPLTPRRKKAHQMLSPRWLARLTVPIMAGAALVTGSAIATADPTSDAYLDQLRGLGFTWPPGHEEALIGMALLICEDLNSGFTRDRVAQDIHSNLDGRGIHYGQVEAMVHLAHSTYCPNATCWVAPGSGASWC